MSTYIAIWFLHLNTDWFSLRQPVLKTLPLVLRTPSHGRMVITSTNAVAESKGIRKGMVLADARAIIPDLQIIDDQADLPQKLLRRIAEWCIRFTPIVAVDLPDGLLFDASGCSHLWGGDEAYVGDIVKRLTQRGYNIRVALADTPGAAWAVARFGNDSLIIPKGKQLEAILPLPPEALRLDVENCERLHKLGFHQIQQFINLPRASLRRRFGQQVLTQLDKVLGSEVEFLDPVIPVVSYQERLPCLEPIITVTGIEIALQELLTMLCLRLQQDQKGVRTAIFKSYRVDGKIEHVEISTNRPSHHVKHLFKLFELKLSSIEPALGIELFVLEASKVEDHFSKQEKMWEDTGGLDDIRLAELLDRIASRVGMYAIHRYVPAEHYWPERSFKKANSLQEELTTSWRTDKQRPLQILRRPERIEVTAPIPDYPPMLFIYKGRIHKIVKADGPERIEQEWWLQQGQHRDYYHVEDESGHRYWLFRLGHYHDKIFQWFIHGYFS
ncbi:Y-family DNA polymerase [Pseudochryseolinea flava]|uniref:DNA polymerase Y family protein n=1 Tax=Pseudochryseolinea flava TaxID=2059302 RepID=A0A364Y168_9BACT|nr:DNA polymerase Y family protein [Pseudochryseolinea flava]RAW00358.1 DNA polymerase Y family protein [Pseudochryseolinea flava]